MPAPDSTMSSSPTHSDPSVDIRPETASATESPTEAGPSSARLRRAWHIVSTAATVALLAALVIGAFFFWPERFGGNTTLVLVSGNSMEPTLRNRDLVFAHSSSDHQVGDVIVYPIPDGQPGAGSFVIHRVIGGDGTSGYVTQGDNRTTPDPWRPTDDEVVGHVFVSTHLGSTFFDWSRTLGSPVVVGAGAGLLAFAAVLRGTRRSPRRVR